MIILHNIIILYIIIIIVLYNIYYIAFYGSNNEINNNENNKINNNEILLWHYQKDKQIRSDLINIRIKCIVWRKQTYDTGL